MGDVGEHKSFVRTCWLRARNGTHARGYWRSICCCGAPRTCHESQCHFLQPHRRLENMVSAAILVSMMSGAKNEMSIDRSRGGGTFEFKMIRSREGNEYMSRPNLSAPLGAIAWKRQKRSQHRTSDRECVCERECGGLHLQINAPRSALALAFLKEIHEGFGINRCYVSIGHRTAGA